MTEVAALAARNCSKARSNSACDFPASAGIPPTLCPVSPWQLAHAAARSRTRSAALAGSAACVAVAQHAALNAIAQRRDMAPQKKTKRPAEHSTPAGRLRLLAARLLDFCGSRFRCRFLEAQFDLLVL